MNQETIPVSVVVPCYRCADTIERAVASIAAQTRRPAEVILVDDASGDGTLSKLHELSDLHAAGWIRILALPANSGPGSARNAGWEQATQTYIAFLDSDDSWHPVKLETQYRWMVDHADFILTGHATSMHSPSTYQPLTERDVPVLHISPSGLMLSNRFQTSTVMLRRVAPFRFDPSKRYCEDYLLWLQIVCSGGKAARIDLLLAFQYKPVYGAGGLSGHLWKMEKGELDALRRVYREELIGLPAYVLVSVWSLIKYGRRLVASLLRDK